jgi:Protein of unknown function (DUF2970)
MLMTEPQHQPRKASPFQVAKAVLSAFIGIRKRAAHQEDAVTITLLQVIVTGIICAAIFVASLITLVRYITS